MRTANRIKKFLRPIPCISRVCAPVALTAVLCCTVFLFVTEPAQAKRGLPDDIVETGCGAENTGGQKILIAVATKYGRTFEIGEAIADVLCSEGMQVDVLFLDSVEEEDIAGYDGVIVGSGIYIEHLYPSAQDFLQNFELSLADKPVAYYLVCALVAMPIDDVDDLVEKYYIDPLYELYPAIDPLDIGVFAGAVNYRILLPIDWLMLRLMFMRGGDWTDWDAVTLWAEDIADML